MIDKIVEIIVELTGETSLKTNLELDLIENDILDSLSFIELINTLEEEFDIEIQPTQVPKDTWRTVEKISKMVEEKIKKS